VPDFHANNDALLNHLKTLVTANPKGAQPTTFIAIGDLQLAALDTFKAELVKFDPQDAALDPTVKAFSPGLAALSTLKPFAPGLTVADLLDPAKSVGTCQTQFHQALLPCVLDNLHPRIVFLAVGQADIERNTPGEAFAQGLNQAIQLIEQHGAIPVLVTIAGTSKLEDAPKLAAYNTVIATVASSANVPLFNLYAALNVPGAPLLTANGLPSLPNKPDQNTPELVGSNFTAAGLKFGVNVVNLNLFRFVDSLQKLIGS